MTKGLTTRKRKRRQESVTWTRAEKLKLLGSLMPFAILLYGYFHFYFTRKEERQLDYQMSQWRTLYHLNEDQTLQIRALEVAFHHTNNPFLSTPHSGAEPREHRQAIAWLMNPEDGERYLSVTDAKTIDIFR